MRRIIASSQRADTYSIMVEPRPAGATIGLYRGLPIAERVVDQFNRRFTYLGVIGRRRDGQYDVNALKPGQFVVEPGLVYGLETGEGQAQAWAEAQSESESESQEAEDRRVLIQVCATLPDNFIAFEYPARFEPFWYEITSGFDGVPVKNGLIDVPDRPGLGVDLIPDAARAHLSEGDADFFD